MAIAICRCAGTNRLILRLSGGHGWWGSGASFKLLGPGETMLRSSKPVIAVCAVRTGCGKSQISRAVVKALRRMGRKVVSIRHPMPYGDLKAERVQRFASYEDLDRHNCTIEEREEYEPYIDLGAVIYAGVDFEAILREAEQGADVIVINKIDTADPEGVVEVRESIAAVDRGAAVVDAASPIFVADGEQIRGKRVLVIEDGPTHPRGDEVRRGRSGGQQVRRCGAGGRHLAVRRSRLDPGGAPGGLGAPPDGAGSPVGTPLSKDDQSPLPRVAPERRSHLAGEGKAGRLSEHPNEQQGG